MSAFRKGIAMLLVAWITMIGQVAVAMPFYQGTQPIGLSAMQQMHDEANVFTADTNDSGWQDCSQHHKPGESKNSLDCNACGMCHMACHAIPQAANTEHTLLPNRVYISAPSFSLLSVVPEQPQHIPLVVVA